MGAEHLVLLENSFSGRLPEDIGLLENLGKNIGVYTVFCYPFVWLTLDAVNLDVANNTLDGPLPVSLSQCANLGKFCSLSTYQRGRLAKNLT